MQYHPGMINRNSFTPIYIQIAQAVIQNVQEGHLVYGEQLPSERELAERYNVSRVTARQAIDELVKRSIAYRVQGKGTFLARPKIREASGLMSFSDELRQRGFRPTSKVLVQKIVPAPLTVAEKFHLSPGESVFYLQRVRLADGEPVAVEYAYLNLQLLPGLEQHSFENQSLFEVLHQHYGVYPTWAEAEIEARIVTDEEAVWLAMERMQAVLVAHRLTFTEAFDVIEVVDSVYAGDRFPIYMGRQRILGNLEEKS
jgi:GntR family transcriptional regulator